MLNWFAIISNDIVLTYVLICLVRVGKNIITRRSHDSSLTKPWSRTIKQMELAAGQGGAADFCGCGWPQHLYIPKGNRHGMPFDLFVMATNYDEDRVEDSPKDLQFPEPCNSPYIFCGLPRRRYPDKRPLVRSKILVSRMRKFLNPDIT